MKKLVFFIVIAFVFQMFYGSVFGQTNTISGQPIIFKTDGSEGLQLKKGRNDDFTLYFPLTDIHNTKWNRIIAKNSLAFCTNNRGVSDDNLDLILSSSGKIGIGVNEPSEKLTVNGNIKLENNGKLMSNNELEFTGNTFSFNAGGVKGLQFKKGMNNDFTLFFPISDANNSRWSRIIAANNLSFTAGNRGTTKNETDLFIHTNGKIGIGTTAPSEKLTVSGNIKIQNGKYILQDTSTGINFDISFGWKGGGTDTQDYLGLFTNTNHGLILGTNNKPIMDIVPNNGKGYVIIYKDGVGISPDSINQEYRDEYALIVEDGILSEDFAIGSKDEWADYVFSKDYKL
jgi:hypothetical protein